MKENLLGYHAQIRNRLQQFGAQVTDAGLVDNPEKARKIGSQFRSQEVEMIFLFVSTYALSSTVLPVAPVIILNL